MIDFRFTSFFLFYCKLDTFLNLINTIVNMINQSFLFILTIAIPILMGLIVFILIIVVAVITVQKKLEPDYNKGFAISFIIYLIMVMFSFIITFLIWESNNSFAHILLSFSLEIYLFHKKSEWKFAILATILLCISIILCQ